MRKAVYSERRFAVSDAGESKGVPIVCKRDGRKSCSDYLRRGPICHRPKRKAESADRFEPADMRELVHLAATRQHRHMNRQCARLYGMPDGEQDARYEGGCRRPMSREESLSTVRHDGRRRAQGQKPASPSGILEKITRQGPRQPEGPPRELQPERARACGPAGPGPVAPDRS